MGVASRRRSLADIVLLVGAFALLAVVSLGLVSQLRSLEVWLVLLGLAAAAPLLVRTLLARLLSPLVELSLLLARRREPRLPILAAAERFAPFSELASLAIELSAREHKARAELSSVGAAAGGDRSTFLRSVSHELRTPLNAILGFTDVLLSELDGPVSADQRENLAIIRSSAERLSRLVNDMIDVAQLAATDGTRPRTELDVAALLDEVREAVEERRGMRPVYVRASVDRGIAPLVAEREGLRRALRILAEHAIEATDSGEVALLCERADREHVFRVQADGLVPESAALSILNGATAACETRPHAERAALLRLAIARELLLLQGGRIEIVTTDASTADNVRTTIVVRMPSEVVP